MFSLPHPNVDNDSVLTRIIAAKHLAARYRMRGVEAVIKAAYATYPLAKPTPLGLTTDVADNFRESYTNNASDMAEQRKIILANHECLMGSDCPMCGIGDTLPLDHNLPKETFPEFAVFAPNLVPICTRCNGIKLAQWVPPTIGRRFLNPYFDDLANKTVLCCDLAVGNDGVASIDFRLDTAGLTPELSSTVASHFKELRLRSRYKKEGSKEWSRRMKYTKEQRKIGAWTMDDVRQTLETEHGTCLTNEGGNYWKTCLWAASLNLSLEKLELASRP